MTAFAGPDGPKTVGKPEIVHTVIIDGIWGWHTRWQKLGDRIAAEVGPCTIWKYDSSGFTSLETLGSRLVAEIKRNDGPVHLVGFSMGGLIVREAMRQDPSINLRKVVLINSPHSGSLLAWLLPLRTCIEMRPGSPFLKRLNAAEWNHPTMVTWCPADLMVFPGKSARWHKATHVVKCDVPAHDWPVMSQGIHRSVVKFLADE